jgi:hypothetical protein
VQRRDITSRPGSAHFKQRARAICVAFAISIESRREGQLIGSWQRKSSMKDGACGGPV